MLLSVSSFPFHVLFWNMVVNKRCLFCEKAQLQNFHLPSTSQYFSKYQLSFQELSGCLTMVSLTGPTNPFPPSFSQQTRTRTQSWITFCHKPDPQPSNALVNGNNGRNTVTEAERRFDPAKMKEIEYRERKEATNRKIASQKAISVILRREAMKAVIEKKKGGSKKLLPRTVLDTLHERITALRWESALKVC